MYISIVDKLLTHNKNEFFASVERKKVSQATRRLKIAILNLMPTKIATENQLLQLLGNTALQIDVTLVRMGSHRCKNTPEEHLSRFYQTFQQIRQRSFDALVVTGAPVEHLPFEQVDYWQELQEFMDWGLSNISALFYICWGAQAALYHHYGIPKHPLPAKQFGVFPHRIVEQGASLLFGFDDVFYVPHSRHTETRRADIEKVPGLKILVESEQAGVYLVASQDGRQIFVTGHSEYDPLTLKSEYERDVAAGLPIAIPVNYFPRMTPPASRSCAGVGMPIFYSPTGSTILSTARTHSPEPTLLYQT
jgi:homoserine O-succinyltransferase/O-acetyltransferase